MSSSPHEYIEARRKHSDPSPARRKEAIAQYLTSEELERFSCDCKGDMSQHLLELLKPRLPASITAILDSEKVAIGLIDDPIPNAHLISLDNGYAIAINSGLIEFIYRITRALSTKFIASTDSKEDCFTIEETSRIIFEIFDWYIGSWQRIGKEHAAGPQYSVNRTQVIFASNLALEAEGFFLAHEIGHLLCELSKTSSLDLSALKEEGEDEETFADKFAFWAIMSAWGKPESKDYHPDLAFAGAFVALRMFDALSKYCESSYQKTFSGPHPNAGQRITNLINWTWELCGKNAKGFQQVTRLGGVIEFIFSHIEYRFDCPKFEDYYKQSATQVTNQLEELLTSYSSDELFSDQATFRERAHIILNKGYPTLLMNQIAREIVEPLIATRALSDEEFAALTEQQKLEGRIMARKLILLHGLVDEFREPYQAIWLQALCLNEKCPHKSV